MSTLVAEPVIVQEVKAEPSVVIHDQQKDKQSTRIAETKELHPMLVVFIACVIAFNVAAAMIGTLAAWVYQLRHSGAFAP